MPCEYLCFDLAVWPGVVLVCHYPQTGYSPELLLCYTGALPWHRSVVAPQCPSQATVPLRPLSPGELTVPCSQTKDWRGQIICSDHWYDCVLRSKERVKTVLWRQINIRAISLEGSMKALCCYLVNWEGTLTPGFVDWEVRWIIQQLIVNSFCVLCAPV